VQYSTLKVTWEDIQTRCYNVSNKAYPDYGLKGVRVAPIWQTYAGFMETLPAGWFEGATLDRLDSNGDYTPSNCRWIPKEDQTSVGKQSLRWNNKTGVIGVEELQAGFYRVLIRERGYPRGKGPKRTLYRGTDFDEACRIRAAWVAQESQIPASQLKGTR
jgi:hypothetical protein